MEALQMLKYSVRKGRGLNFTEGTDEMSEIHELELLIEQQTSVLKDMQHGHFIGLKTLLYLLHTW